MKKQLKITGPTWLTFLRIVLAVLFLIFVLGEMKLLALILFVLAAITDAIDGYWARKKKITTNLGAFLDPLADKMLVDLAFLVLVYLGVVPIWAFAIILVRDLMVDGVRMVAAQSGKTLAASPFGKVKTVLQMTALTTLLLNLTVTSMFLGLLGNVFLYTALALTIVSGLDYLIANRSIFVESKK